MRRRKANPLTIEEIKIILALSRGGTLSAAAKSLHMHVSTVSRAVTAIEEKIGQTVFDRQNPGAKIGRKLKNIIPLAQEIIEGVDRFNDNIQDLIEGRWREKRRFHVKMPEWMTDTFRNADLAGILAADPNLDISISSQDNLLENAEEVAVSFSISRLDNCVVRRLGDIDFVAAAAPSYIALAGRPRSINELRHHRVVLSLAQRDIHDLAHWYDLIEASESNRLYVETMRDVLASVRDGFGVGVLPAALARTHNLETFPDLFVAGAELWLCFGRDTGEDAIGRAVIAAVEETVKSAE